VRVKSEFALLAFTHGAALEALAASHAPVATALLHKAMQLHLRRFGLPRPDAEEDEADEAAEREPTATAIGELSG
jgi:hypothetical protein